jgi:hypothetical protein
VTTDLAFFTVVRAVLPLGIWFVISFQLELPQSMRAEPIVAQKNHPCPPVMLLSGGRMRNGLFKALPVLGEKGEVNTSAHADAAHCSGKRGH